MIWYIVIGVVALIVGAAVGAMLRKVSAEKKVGSAEEQARKILEDAIKNAENAKKESIISAKEEIFQLKKEADRDINERRKEVSRQERRNTQKEETLDAKLEKIEKKEALLAECKEAADVAPRAGVMLCMECHKRTFTECASDAVWLMKEGDSPHFQMYWQPNQFKSEKENLVDVCVVVTRYFGGILLGGGGLVRAYSHSAKIGVDSAKIITMALFLSKCMYVT